MGRVRVRLTPRATEDAVLAAIEDAAGRGAVVPVRVTAAPVGGRANAALERVLARRLGVPPSSVRVVAGHTARTKTVEVDGLDDQAILERLGGASGAR